MPDQPYSYYAFISYSRKDEKWAKWLQRKLEGYRLPRSVRKESGGRIPKYLRPVFRDKTDLTVGQSVSQNLRRELAESRYLIVICSPHSAQSSFVDLEIRNFQELGRSDRIIPFIVSGTPSPKKPSEKQCYPPALSQGSETMLGVSLKELSANKALVKVVAAMVGLKFDHLWQRHNRHRRLRRLVTVPALGLLLFAVYSFVDFAAFTHTRYYDDYVERKGVPKGIEELSAAQVAHRASSWRMDYQQGKLREVKHVNSADTAILALNPDERGRPSRQKFSYTEDGRVLHVSDFTHTDHFYHQRQFTHDLNFMQFRHQEGVSGSNLGHVTAMTTQDSGVRPDQKKSDIIAYYYTYNNFGFIKNEMYLNAADKMMPDANGVFGKHFTYTSAGRLASITFLDEKRHPVEVRGVATRRFFYDENGNRQKVQWLDASGALTYNSDHFAQAVFTTDAWGNRTREVYLDPAGKPCLHKEGYAICDKEYDAHGNMIKMTFRDVDEQPCYNDEGVSIIKMSYDKQGRKIKASFFDANGAPCLSKKKFSSVSAKYDSHGNRIKEVFFDSQGKPCKTIRGFASIEYQYNANGNVTKLSFFDENNNPCLSDDKVACIIVNYDEYDNEKENTFLDTGGNPCSANFGCANVKFEYDERGNKIKQRCFGPDGNPAVMERNIATLISEFDKRGNETRQLYLGRDGKPTLRDGRYAVLVSDYDSHGNNIKRSYLDTAGRPCATFGGVATVLLAYDKYGNVIKESYFDANGRPCLRNNDYAGIKMVYDALGHEISRTYFDLSGHPCRNRAGLACLQSNFDARGHLVREAYFGTDGRPCLRNGTYASRRLDYDARGNLVKETYFDIAGHPCRNQDAIARGQDQDETRETKRKEPTFGLDNTPAQSLQMARVSQVVPQSPAAANGMRSDDILFEFCYWRWEKDRQLQQLPDAIKRCQDIPKHIFAIGQDGHVRAFDAPAGAVGMKLDALPLNTDQAKALQFVYSFYSRMADLQKEMTRGADQP